MEEKQKSIQNKRNSHVFASFVFFFLKSAHSVVEKVFFFLNKAHWGNKSHKIKTWDLRREWNLKAN